MTDSTPLSSAAGVVATAPPRSARAIAASVVQGAALGFVLHWFVGLFAYQSAVILVATVLLAVAIALAAFGGARAAGRGLDASRARVLGAVGGFLGRMLLVSSFLLLALHSSAALRTLCGIMGRPVGLVVLGNEIGIAEAVVRARTREMRRDDPPAIDPFSGGAMMGAANDARYSIGPDLRDDALSVLYDPTNGIISAGDIPSGPRR